MDRIGGHCPFLWNVWKPAMTMLILDEDQIFENDDIIPDLSLFLKNLPPKTEITLILKTHDALYHLCPIPKAVPYLKSAEFPSEYWVGEKKLSKGRTLVGGILPSPFMHDAVNLLAEYSFAIKGIFLWADLVIQAYGPLPLGWALILHDQHLMVCHDGILRVSRSCYLPFADELPAILRYLKRFGYQEGVPLTLLKTSLFTEALPSFIHQESRIPHNFSPEGFTLEIPELIPLQGLYSWPRKIQKTAYALTFLNLLGIAYFSWQITILAEAKHILKEQLSRMPKKELMDETKMEAFAAYCHVSEGKPNPLLLFRQIAPFIKEVAVATYLHWTDNPVSLRLHLGLTPSTEVDQFLLTLRSQLQGYVLNWQAGEGDALKGILTINKVGQQEKQ
jgi:hypothetical protein